MNNDELIKKLKVVVKPYIHNQEAFDNLTPQTDFIKDLKINSANLVDIVLDLEEAFDITIDAESMEKMLDVGTAVAIVEAKLKESDR